MKKLASNKERQNINILLEQAAFFWVIRFFFFLLELLESSASLPPPLGLPVFLICELMGL